MCLKMVACRRLYIIIVHCSYAMAFVFGLFASWWYYLQQVQRCHLPSPTGLTPESKTKLSDRQKEELNSFEYYPMWSPVAIPKQTSNIAVWTSSNAIVRCILQESSLFCFWTVHPIRWFPLAILHKNRVDVVWRFVQYNRTIVVLSTQAMPIVWIFLQ